MSVTTENEQEVRQEIDDRKADKKNTPQEKSSGMSLAGYLIVLLMGAYLGIVFVKSEVATWQRVHKMFLFEEAHMYLIISLAILMGLISVQLINRFKIRDVAGKPIVYKPKPFQPGVVLGGICFGAGWALTGACPGPIYVQVGGGEWMALFTLAGALLGMFCFAILKPKLP